MYSFPLHFSSVTFITLLLFYSQSSSSPPPPPVPVRKRNPEKDPSLLGGIRNYTIVGNYKVAFPQWRVMKCSFPGERDGQTDLLIDIIHVGLTDQFSKIFLIIIVAHVSAFFLMGGWMDGWNGRTDG